MTEIEGNDDIDDALSITYDTKTESYHVVLDPDDEISVSVAIVHSLAAIMETDPDQLEPLYDRIDPSGLDQLYDPDRYSLTGRPVVSFSYAGHRVRVELPTELRIDP